MGLALAQPATMDGPGNRIVYLSMGVEGRYYLRLTPTPPHCNAHCNSNPNRRYQSGATHCSAGQDPDLYVALQQGEVSKVAFGCTVHTWFVLYANGEYRWSNIDPDMEARVFRDPTCEAKTLRDVTLGPAGEWWVAWADGTCKLGGVGPGLKGKWKELASMGHPVQICHVLFGPLATWLVRFSFK